MTSPDAVPPPETVDVRTPNLARMYDYYLGGSHNLAVDRAAADQVIAANPNFLAVLGYSLEEIRGRHHSLFVDPAERESPA